MSSRNGADEENGRPTTVAEAAMRPDWFGKAAAWTTRATGGRWGFLTAFGMLLVWAATGPYFGFSENWQMVVNTGTSIVTFLMVFLIQNAQNRESKALHLKLDELILTQRHARNELIDVEHLTEEQLDRLGERYSRVAEKHQEDLAVALEHKVDEVEDEVDQGEPAGREHGAQGRGCGAEGGEGGRGEMIGPASDPPCGPSEAGRRPIRAWRG